MPRDSDHEYLPVGIYRPALGKIRCMNGVSQMELSAESGVSQGNISLFETGKQIPTLPVAWRLVKAMQALCSITLSFEDIWPPTPHNPYDPELRENALRKIR